MKTNINKESAINKNDDYDISNKIKTMTYTANSTVTNIVHNLPYNPTTDLLQVIYLDYGVVLQPIINYTENVSNASIDLVAWNLINGQQILFNLFKNIK